jgi:hypothetical protein
VEWREAAVEVRIQLRKLLVEALTDLAALERARRGKDRHLLQDLERVERAPLLNIVHLERAERRVVREEARDLVLDHADVRAEVVRREPELDEPLLLHEALVRNVVHHVFPKHGRRQVLVGAA